MKNVHSFYRNHLARPALAAGVVGVLAVVLVTAFSWPGSNVAPRDVPVAAAGSAQAVAGLESTLDERSPGSFEVVPAATEAAALDLIADREVYGAVVVGAEGPSEVVVASAASPAVAQILERTFASVAAGQPTGESPAVAVDDVAPLPADDPQGAGMAGALLPLTLTGIVGSVLGLRLVDRRSDRLTTAVLSAFTVGTGIWLVVDPWLGAVGTGSSWGVWAALVAGAAALGLTAAGAIASLGLRGLGLVAAAFVLLGNPLSGASSAPELLPDGWSSVSQLFPQGAVTALLRSFIGFDGAGATAPAGILAAWIVLGLLLFALGGRRPEPGGDEADAPATDRAVDAAAH